MTKTQFKIKHELPPIWDRVLAKGLKPNPEYVVFTYGDTIYIPGGKPMPDHLIEHECTHVEQQKEYPGGRDAWWDRYISDGLFRIQQEVEAYASQYRFICAKVKDRNHQNSWLLGLARDLSSPMYGSVVGPNGAYRMIKEKAHI